MQMNTARRARRLVIAAGTAWIVPTVATGQVVFYSESFDSAARTSVSADPAVNTACAVGNKITDVPPAGWSVDDCGVRTYYCREGLIGGACPATGSCGGCGADAGIIDFEGWAFADRVWWGNVDPQGRQNFTLSTGNCAVADPDEWDDEGGPAGACGKYNALMSSPAIGITLADAGSLSFRFDSSWLPEGFDDLVDNNQTARIRAFYTVGGVEQAPVTILLWDSNPLGPNYKADAGPDGSIGTDDDPTVNESVTIANGDLQIPIGATAVRFEFGLLEAANDWWWAIDNLALNGTIGGAPQVFFAEGFDGVPLAPPQEEGVGGCAAAYCGVPQYTHTGPNGVLVPLDPVTTGGVPDWAGWSFNEVTFWNCVSGQGRGQFTLGDGAVAIADGDEWTDGPAANSGTLNTTLATPSISISGREGDVLVLQFDSSWNDEPNQTASIVAEYNVGGVINVASWSSVPTDPNYKAANLNERIFLPMYVPAGATSVVLKFNYVAGNNWWWAIDDLRVFEGEADITLETENPFTSTMGLAPSYNFDPCFAPWAPEPPAGWSESPFTGTNGVEEWRGWSFAWNEWWYTNVADQGRSGFQLGDGFVAIADPDEWDDAPNGQTFFNSFITTPSIAVPNTFASATLEFDSSWQYEGFDDAPGNTNNQTATIVATYTVGGVPQPPVEVLRWDSDDDDIDGLPSAFFKPDAPNEHVTLNGAALQIPVGATAVSLEFGLSNARNDWWWAIDDVKLSFDGATAFIETFEAPGAAQTPPSEPLPTTLCAYWSSIVNQGTGYSADTTGITGCDQGLIGDWYGFNAWLTDAWVRSAPGDRRGEFPSRTGYISDFKRSGCDGTALLVSPVFNIGGVNAGTLALNFRSGFFAEAGHLGKVEVSYDGGTIWTTALTWDSDAPVGNPTRKETNTNELVSVNLNNPSGATTVRFRISDANAGWWAISEISLTGTVGSTPSCTADFNSSGSTSVQDIYDFLSDWNSQIAGGPVIIGSADFNTVGGVSVQDLYDYFSAWNADITSGLCQ